MGRLLWEGSVVCVVYLGELCRGLACCGRVWWSSPSAALNCRLRLSAGTRTMINNESEADWNSLPRRLCGSVQLRAHPGPTASASSSLVSILAKFARCAPVIKRVYVCVCVCVCVCARVSDTRWQLASLHYLFLPSGDSHPSRLITDEVLLYSVCFHVGVCY